MSGPTLADRVKETTATAGNGPVSMGGAMAGYQAFSAAFATGTQVPYCIDGGTEWEVGLGTLTAGAHWTLSRDTVLSSSNAGALVVFSAGTKEVFDDLPAGLVVLQAQAMKLTSLRL